MLQIQTEEAVAYKPTLARPLARNPHYGVEEGRCGGCEPSIVRRRSCGRTTSSRWAARYILLHTTPACPVVRGYWFDKCLEAKARWRGATTPSLVGSLPTIRRSATLTVHVKTMVIFSSRVCSDPGTSRNLTVGGSAPCLLYTSPSPRD